MQVVEHTFTAQSVSRLALRLHGAIRDRALALPDDAELLDELANVRLRETSPGVYRLDHDAGRHDDRAVALALAADYLLARVPFGPTRVLSPNRLRRLPVEALAARAGIRVYDGGAFATPGSYAERMLRRYRR